MWARFISEGKPVEGAPELFEFDGVRCNQPFYDEDKVCEVRVVESGKLLYSKLFLSRSLKALKCFASRSRNALKCFANRTCVALRRHVNVT